MFTITPSQGAFIVVFSWIVWYAIRRFVIKTALDNLPGPPSSSFVFGNFKQVNSIDGWDFHRDISDKYGAIVKLKAFLGENHLYVFDPKAMHHIVVKDQHIFQESHDFIIGNRLVFGDGLLSTLGDHHRKQRKMLNPVFSIAHMRNMVPIFWDVANKLRDAIKAKVENGPQEVDMLHWMTRTALELVGQSGFGYSFDPLIENGTPHRFSVAAKELVPALTRLIFLRKYFLKTVLRIGSPKFRRFILDIFPWKAAHKVRDITDIMHETAVQIIESKRRALQEGDEAVKKQVGRGKDIISILLRENMNASAEDRLSETELTGQISTFAFAATDTTAMALSRTLYLLANYPDVQERLREEILEARKDHGDISYDRLVLLPYLDAVCRETLRLYPPVSTVFRNAQEDVILPLSNSVTGLDGREMHEILVPKGTEIVLSIISANRNPDIWGPDSYEWKPERWLSPLPDAVPTARIPGIYSHLMTFLGGGRACIGFKFSQLEMKVVLASLLSAFRFENSDQEIFWQMNRIASPVVGRKDRFYSSLPMKISLLSDAA